MKYDCKIRFRAAGRENYENIVIEADSPEKAAAQAVAQGKAKMPFALVSCHKVTSAPREVFADIAYSPPVQLTESKRGPGRPRKPPEANAAA